MTPPNPPPPTVVAIDGPAGSGKSTVARALAKRLDADWAYLDSGAMYRALTVLALERGVDLLNVPALVALAKGVHIELSREGVVKVDGRDLSHEIRTERTNA